MNKIASYLGFAIKSRNIIFGFDNLCETKKKIVTVITDNTINNKLKDKLIQLCEYRKWELLTLNDCTLSDLLNRNCKMVGVTDVHLAQAIKQNI